MGKRTLFPIEVATETASLSFDHKFRRILTIKIVTWALFSDNRNSNVNRMNLWNSFTVGFKLFGLKTQIHNKKPVQYKPKDILPNILKRCAHWAVCCLNATIQSFVLNCCVWCCLKFINYRELCKKLKKWFFIRIEWNSKFKYWF